MGEADIDRLWNDTINEGLRELPFDKREKADEINNYIAPGSSA